MLRFIEAFPKYSLVVCKPSLRGLFTFAFSFIQLLIWPKTFYISFLFQIHVFYFKIMFYVMFLFSFLFFTFLFFVFIFGMVLFSCFFYFKSCFYFQFFYFSFLFFSHGFISCFYFSFLFFTCLIFMFLFFVLISKYDFFIFIPKFMFLGFVNNIPGWNALEINISTLLCMLAVILQWLSQMSEEICMFRDLILRVWPGICILQFRFDLLECSSCSKAEEESISRFCGSTNLTIRKS